MIYIVSAPKNREKKHGYIIIFKKLNIHKKAFFSLVLENVKKKMLYHFHCDVHLTNLQGNPLFVAYDLRYLKKFLLLYGIREVLSKLLTWLGYETSQLDVAQRTLIKSYSMSKKSWPSLFSNLLYTMGQDLLGIQYVVAE